MHLIMIPLIKNTGLYSPRYLPHPNYLLSLENVGRNHIQFRIPYTFGKIQRRYQAWVSGFWLNKIRDPFLRCGNWELIWGLGENNKIISLDTLSYLLDLAGGVTKLTLVFMTQGGNLRGGWEGGRGEKSRNRVRWNLTFKWEGNSTFNGKAGGGVRAQAGKRNTGGRRTGLKRSHSAAKFRPSKSKVWTLM